MSRDQSDRWVYLVGSLQARPVKIGTAVNPEGRLGELRTGSPVPLHLVWKTRGGRALERGLHDHFAAYRIHGEWFDFGDENPAALVATAAVQMGYLAHAERVTNGRPEPELPLPIKLARAAFAAAGDPRRMTSTELHRYVATSTPGWGQDGGDTEQSREAYLRALRAAVAVVDPDLDMTTKQWAGGRGYYLDTIRELTGELAQSARESIGLLRPDRRQAS